ncbi:cytochrome b/b6 domain-containing protein [Pacificimonas pallii]|nr:cytochrome b/b6 domain-containing protein [Pacificimonas pallii]
MSSNAKGPLVKRHRLSTRVWHWTNMVAIFLLIGSGATIFNAHPRLYWGEYGANFDPAWLVIDDRQSATGPRGFVNIGGAEFDTTGVLGVFEKGGETRMRAFPHWVTIPAEYSLSAGRRYHLLGAWIFGVAGFVYFFWSLFNRHIQRDLIPRKWQLTPACVRADIKNHIKLNFIHSGTEKYSLLQKLSYAGVILVILPVLVATGLTMSPNMNAAWPWLLDIFGGRQSARSLHFIAAFLLIAFIFVHLILVVLAGPYNEIRSMITGKLRLPAGDGR